MDVEGSANGVRELRQRALSGQYLDIVLGDEARFAVQCALQPARLLGTLHCRAEADGVFNLYVLFRTAVQF